MDQPNLITHANGVPLQSTETVPVFASWTELSTPKIKTVTIESLNRTVQYLSFVPLDKILEFQARYHVGTPKGDRMGFMAEVLKFVMVSPACRTIEEARAAIKSSGPIVMGIINEVIAPKEFEEAQATVDAAKTSPGSPSAADS